MKNAQLLESKTGLDNPTVSAFYWSDVEPFNHFINGTMKERHSHTVSF